MSLEHTGAFCSIAEPLPDTIAKTRRDDPAYDQIWREWTRGMADDWDRRALAAMNPLDGRTLNFLNITSDATRRRSS